MRDGWMRGTMAASLMRPMRRPLRSSTGMPASSVKNKRLSAIENAPAPDNSSACPDKFSTLALQCALHGFFRRQFQYGALRGGGATKKVIKPTRLAEQVNLTVMAIAFH